MRFTSNALSNFKDKEMSKLLKMHQSLVVLESSSSGEDDYDFKIREGYFSSDDEKEQPGIFQP